MFINFKKIFRYQTIKHFNKSAYLFINSTIIFIIFILFIKTYIIWYFVINCFNFTTNSGKQVLVWVLRYLYETSTRMNIGATRVWTRVWKFFQTAGMRTSTTISCPNPAHCHAYKRILRAKDLCWLISLTHKSIITITNMWEQILKIRVVKATKVVWMIS